MTPKFTIRTTILHEVHISEQLESLRFPWRAVLGERLEHPSWRCAAQMGKITITVSP